MIDWAFWSECFLFFGIGAFWRRWFGGGFGKFGDVSRGWKYLVLVGAVLAMYAKRVAFDWTDWQMWRTVAAFALFWALSHGAWYVYWDKSASGEGRKPLLDRWLWFLVGIDGSRTFWGNCLGMFNRYELTAVLVALCIPSWWFLAAGALVALEYVPAGRRKDTRLGECLAGGAVFAWLYACI